MKAVVRRSILLEETYKQKDEEKRDKFESILNEYVELLSKLSSPNLSELSNKEYYELMNEFYVIKFDEEDYLYALSRQNGRNYSSFKEIDTDIVVSKEDKSGYGNSIVWSKDNKKVKYIAAVSDIVNFNPNKKYSKDELIKMVNNRNIVVIGSKTIKLDKIPEDSEVFETFPMIDINNRNLDDFIKANEPLFGSILKEYFEKNGTKLLDDIIKFMNELNFQLRGVTIFNKGIYENANLEMKKWWINSDLKDEYENIEQSVRSR